VGTPVGVADPRSSPPACVSPPSIRALHDCALSSDGSWGTYASCGDMIRTLAAQVNEVLLKCLCHNLSMLVHAIHELWIAPSFWSRMEAR
jgi:hypothetical protein